MSSIVWHPWKGTQLRRFSMQLAPAHGLLPPKEMRRFGRRKLGSMLPQRQQIPENANDANVSGLLNAAQPCRRRAGEPVLRRLVRFFGLLNDAVGAPPQVACAGSATTNNLSSQFTRDSEKLSMLYALTKN